MTRTLVLVVSVALVGGCGVAASPDAGLDADGGPDGFTSTDAGRVADAERDAGVDATNDAGPLDAALPDAALPDAALLDAALPDAALPDAALLDAALPDAAPVDMSLADVAVSDATVVDAPPPDAPGCSDADGDGYPAVSCGGDDCDDGNASVHPGAAETCNGVDDDCDGATDDGVCVPCPAGYTGLDGACTDVDECAAGADDCDDDPPASCMNTVGAFACGCPPGFSGTGHGTSGCRLSDPSLVSLVPSAGALGPVFAPATLAYSLPVPAGTASVTLTPSVAFPGHTTITVDGVTVTSGTASAPITVPGRLAVRAVTVRVTTETGSSRTYTVVVSLSSTYVKASNTDANDWFGFSVALSSDGSTLAVGALHEASAATGVDGDQTSNAAGGSGAVYVYTRVAGVWAQEAYLKASNTGGGDRFGESVALSSDGSTLAVGAAGEASHATGIGGDQTDDSAANSGAAYVFVRSAGTWTQQAYVKASNTDPDDNFGHAVALSSDGSTLAVGAEYEASSATGVGGDQTSNAAVDSGAVYVFARSGVAWSQQAYIKASNTGMRDYFGQAVALSSDGATLAVGAYEEDSSARGIGGDQTSNAALDAGAVYVFTRSGVAWSQQAYVKASNAHGDGWFGHAVAISSDGATLAVGAPGESSSATGIGGIESDTSLEGAGAAYVFRRVGTTWSQQAYVKASNTGYMDAFGWALGLSSDGSTLAVGATGESSIATGIGGDQTSNTAASSGAVYVYTRAGTAWSQQAYVKASNTDPGDQFGWSVAASPDASTLAVGANIERSNAVGIGGDQANNAAYAAGAVYVY